MLPLVHRRPKLAGCAGSPRTPVIWISGLECTCCSESFIRSAHPLAKDVVLSMISLVLAPGLHDGLDPMVKGPWYFLGLQEILHWTPWPVVVIATLYGALVIPNAGAIVTTLLDPSLPAISVSLATPQGSLAVWLHVLAFDLIAGKGLGWEEAMAVIVWEVIFITILMLTGFRKAILEAIPLNLKRAIAVGIGLFLLLIGLFEANVVVKSFAPTVPLSLFSGIGFGGSEIPVADMPHLAIFGAGLLTALALIR